MYPNDRIHAWNAVWYDTVFRNCNVSTIVDHFYIRNSKITFYSYYFDGNIKNAEACGGYYYLSECTKSAQNWQKPTPLGIINAEIERLNHCHSETLIYLSYLDILTSTTVKFSCKTGTICPAIAHPHLALCCSYYNNDRDETILLRFCNKEHHHQKRI